MPLVLRRPASKRLPAACAFFAAFSTFFTILREPGTRFSTVVMNATKPSAPPQ